MIKIKNIWFSLLLGLPVLVSQNAFAEQYHGNYLSHHYSRPREEVRHERGEWENHEEYFEHSRRHCYRPVRYRYGYYAPYYDGFYVPGTYWNMNIGTGGWGFGVRRGW